MMRIYRVKESKIVASSLLTISLYLVLTMGIWAAENSWIVDDVTFTGNNTFPRKVLLKQMVMRPPRFFDKTPFSQSILDDDMGALSSFYRNEGFLDVQIQLKNLERDSLRHRVDIALEIEEGERTFVSGIEIFDNRVFSDSLLHEMVHTAIGQPLISRVIDEDVRRIMDFLAEQGYLEARVSPQVRIDQQEHRAFVEFTVKEGLQITVSDVNIIGTQRVRQNVVTRALRFHRGEILTLSDIRESVRRLYRTGLFRVVEIKPLLGDSQNGERVVNVRLEEMDFGQVEAGIGYGTFDRFRASLEASYGNMFGIGQKAGVRAHASFITQKLELSFSDPWIFGFPVQADANVYYEHHDEPSYEAIFKGLVFTLGKQITEKTSIHLSQRYEDVTWMNVVDTLSQDVEAKDTHSMIASYVFDDRNNLFNPTRGMYYSLDTEIAGLGRPETNQYIKVTCDWRYYWSALSPWYLSSALRFGLGREYGQSDEIPIQERFFAGGSHTVRGFAENKVGPLTQDGTPLGGRTLLVVNIVEGRYPLYKMIAGALFLEAGNVWESWKKTDPSELRWASGVGLRVNLPLGVVRLDYGFNLDRRPGESIGAFHIDMGQAF
jgi:outer membrane protein insertion porin family